MKSLAIIGGGFSGLSTLAALVRHTVTPIQITIYSPDSALGRGRAYSTQDPEHLLNVRAGVMGAHAGEDDDFFLWLVAEGLQYEISDFVPRALYARYLDSVLAETLMEAQKRDIRIFTVHENVTDIVPSAAFLTVKTAKNKKEYDGAVVACGNDRPRLPELGTGVPAHTGWWRHPYMHERFGDIASAGHVVIIGSGLSMVDALVTLKRMNYEGDITAVSRHGLIPHPHPGISTAFTWDVEEINELRSLSAIMRAIRRKSRGEEIDWRDVLDGLRPYSNVIWRNLSPADRKRAQRYMTLWNIHRHRIPQVMHDMITSMTGQGQLRLISGDVSKIEAMGSSLNVYTTAGVKEGQIVMNCLGYDYRIRAQDQGLLGGLARSGLLPVKEDFPAPVTDALQLHQKHALYGVGPMWQGHFIESTAVRDIRLQADLMAQDIMGKWA